MTVHGMTLGHVNCIPTMQFNAGIPRHTQPNPHTLPLTCLKLGFPEMLHHGIHFNIAYSKVRQLKHLICKIYLQVHQI